MKSTALVTASREKRGPQSCPPISSFGVLSTGEPYVVYRFFLYWDAFIVHDTSQASAEGLYLVPFNLEPRPRNSQHSVRVCAASPPDVKVDALFDRLADEIGKGGAEGFLEFDARGTRRRIFLDLLGFVGDTPALNDCLDVRGHCAKAPCHQCRFRRKSSDVATSRYFSDIWNG